VRYWLKIRYLPDFAVVVTLQLMERGSVRRTVYVMSRVCRSVNVAPSVTMYCVVSTLVLSTVG
jgi:hypothetical protein